MLQCVVVIGVLQICCSAPFGAVGRSLSVLVQCPGWLPEVVVVVLCWAGCSAERERVINTFVIMVQRQLSGADSVVI